MLKAADRATALTRQLLAFSRKQIVQPKVVELGALVMDMQQMLKRLLGVNIELSFTSIPISGKARVDPGQIEQVIVNLVVNARDAMPTRRVGLRFILRNMLLEIEGGYSGDALRRRVLCRSGGSGQGTGMDEETRSHLFEPFFTTKEKGRGTGLGLSTSYGIVKQNHGEILVQSELGEGSSFSIYLPRIDEPSGVESSHAAMRGAAKGAETILVAEDEDGVRHIVTQMLREQGYTVLPASGGAEALRIAESHSGPLQLLVSDVMMPRMSGPELAERLRGASARRCASCLSPAIPIAKSCEEVENWSRGPISCRNPLLESNLQTKFAKCCVPATFPGEDMVS